LYDWSYRQTAWFVDDSLSLRVFCRLYDQPAPEYSTLIRWAGALGTETVEALHRRVVHLAREQKVTRGRKLRIDGTVVETTIHYPTDSALLADVGRMIGRVVRRAKAVVGEGAPATLFRDWTRSTKRLARQIGEAARKRSEAGQQVRTTAYRRLLSIMGTVHCQAQEVVERLQASGNAGKRLHTELEALVPLTEQVVQQTVRRLAGEQVPAGDKLVSLVEPHTDILRRNKPQQQTEFGHKLILGEVDGGIISECQVLEGNPPEAPELVGQVDRHREHFGHVPDMVATDRGFYAPGNEAALRARGVKRVAIPEQGKPSPERQTLERSRWFRQGQRFRTGIEGRISVGKRRGWLGRCRDHGQDGFDRWIGWGVLANNLVAIARSEAAQAQKQAA